MSLIVETCATLALIQDRGRYGHSHLGVGPSGHVDSQAAADARRLLDLADDAALIETLGDLNLRATRAVTMAVTGAPAPIEIDGVPVAHGRILRVAAGSCVHVGRPIVGLWVVVAVAGGLHARPVLGSRSTDTLAGLGPAPLAAGQSVPVGPAPVPKPRADVPSHVTGGDVRIRIVPGPRDDRWPRGVTDLLAATWRVDPRSDRVGTRLDGPTLPPPTPLPSGTEPASEPVVRGSIQITTAGLPVVLGPDHPVTGGYPVIAVVITDDLPLLAQARPGTVVRFTLQR